MPRPILRTRLGNRKDTWCRCWPLTTCCSPPSRTAAVLPAQIWWSTVGGSGSTQGSAVCYFPQQPRLSRCPTAQAGSPGLSTVWRLQPGYLPGPLGDSADTGPAWWRTSSLSSWLRQAWWWRWGGQSSEDNNMKSYGFVSHWANGFCLDLSLQAGVLLATVILVTLWHHPPIPSGLDLLPLPHLSVVRRHHRCWQLLPPILFVIIIRVEHVHAGGACCCCCCCIAYAWISQVAHAGEELRWVYTIYCYYLIIYLFCSPSVSCFFFLLCFFLLVLGVGCHFWQER